ncbi:unnamed protein product [Amoebophrya sp. A120]|nr:unnamed protein product [Amoebophrya sp. A120]|eukprot:GSA120T00008041001.1
MIPPRRGHTSLSRRMEDGHGAASCSSRTRATTRTSSSSPPVRRRKQARRGTYFRVAVSLLTSTASLFDRTTQTVEAKKDFYAELGVSPKCRNKECAAEIKKAYRKLALKHHPDKQDVNLPEKKKKKNLSKFQDINNAYETLSDPEKKKKYDEFGEDPSRPGQAADGNSGGGGPDPFDIFAQFFGGGRPGGSSGGGSSFTFNMGGSGGNKGGGKQQQKQPEKPLYDDEDAISEIQGFEDYTNNVAGAKDHYAEQFVIKFYQDGHQPSKDAQKAFVKLAKAYDGAANFYAVSCSRHKRVCEKAGIKGNALPKVKYYGAGEENHDTFKGAKNTYDAMQKWLAKALPDKTVRLKTKEDMEKFMQTDSAKVILFVEKPNTPPRLTLLSVQFGKVLIGVLSKKEAPKLWKEFEIPKKQELPAWLNVHDKTWSPKLPRDEIPMYLQDVQRQYREEMLTPKFDELTVEYLDSGKCSAKDSNYCLVVVSDHIGQLQKIFLEVAKKLKKDPVRIVSLNNKTNTAMKKKLFSITSQVGHEDPAVVLWRPKRRRWKKFEDDFLEMYSKGQDVIVNGLVTFVRDALDSGAALQNRHEEL